MQQELDEKFPQESYIDNGCDKSASGLMRQIKEKTGLSNSELANKLSKIFECTDKQISSYVNGSKSMGKARQLQLAKYAKVNGWITPAVTSILEWDECYQLLGIDEERNDLNLLNKSESRSRKAALASFEKSINNLVEFGYDDLNIIAMAITLTEKLIDPDERTCGGMIDISKIREYFDVKNGYSHPNSAWLTWDFI